MADRRSPPSPRNHGPSKRLQHQTSCSSGGLCPAGPPGAVARGGPAAPLRAGGSLAPLARARPASGGLLSRRTPCAVARGGPAAPLRAGGLPRSARSRAALLPGDSVPPDPLAPSLAGAPPPRSAPAAPSLRSLARAPCFRGTLSRRTPWRRRSRGPRRPAPRRRLPRSARSRARALLPGDSVPAGPPGAVARGGFAPPEPIATSPASIAGRRSLLTINGVR